MDRPRDADRPLDAMCADILERYHASLHSSLPQLRARLATLAAGNPSAVAGELQAAFAGLSEQIAAHLAKEENLLFPAIAALAGAERTGSARPPLAFATVLHPIRMMEAEHVRIAAGLDHLKELAQRMTRSGGGDVAWRSCLVELAVLDAALREHHIVEDQQLFPRALDLERRLVSLG